MKPIGAVVGGRDEPVDDNWGASVATIVLDRAQFTPDAAVGLEEFSHIEVVYNFHLVEASSVHLGTRHPRGNTDWPKVGIFAQRAKNRPNAIGVSVCELLRVEGLVLTVRSLDAIDGTPVLDIKPVMAEFLPRGIVRQPTWSTELMHAYWL